MGKVCECLNVAQEGKYKYMGLEALTAESKILY